MNNACQTCGDSTKQTRTCKTCGTTDQSHFYETQSSHYCKIHHKERYFAPGRARLLNAKLARIQCTDCGLIVTQDNACVFDFDHLNDKIINISQMVTYSDARFEQEIAKCELRCSNCHRIKTKVHPTPHPNPGRPRRNILNWAPLF